MPKLVKITGGYKVVNVYSGKVLGKFTGKDAKKKAHALKAQNPYKSSGNFWNTTIKEEVGL